jgi:DNA replication licensing factor MCM3
MVSLEGIVTKTSLVRPKVVKSVHYNENKQKFHFREYRDQTMTTGAASTSVYPTEDEEGNPVSICRRETCIQSANKAARH